MSSSIDFGSRRAASWRPSFYRFALAAALSISSPFPRFQAWAAEIPSALEESCDKRFQRFSETYKGMELSGLKTTEEAPLFSALFDDPKSVFFSIQNSQHYAIRVGDKTYNGQVLGRPWIDSGAKGDAIPPGLLVRIDGLSDETFSQLQAEAERASRFPSYTCVHFACARLEKVGVDIPELKEKGEVPFRVAPTLDAILRSGFSGPDGQRLQTTLVLNSDISIQQLSKRLEHFDVTMEKLNERRFKRKGLDGSLLSLFEPEVAALILAEFRNHGLRVTGVPPAAGIGAFLVLIPQSDSQWAPVTMPSAGPGAAGAAR